MDVINECLKEKKNQNAHRDVASVFERRESSNDGGPLAMPKAL